MVTEHEPSGVPDEEPGAVIADPPSVTPAVGPWYRRRGVLAGIALAIVAAVAALVFTNGRADDANSAETTTVVDSPSEMPAGPNKTIKQYIEENQISSTQVRRGDPGAPVIGLGLAPGWSGLGADTPPWSYGAVEFDNASDPNDPPTIVVLLSKLTGDVDPAKILEYAPSELKNLPNYEPLAQERESKLSGFDATQLSGRYTRDGQQRTIAQKTVVIPDDDAVYVLQINVDALDSDADAVMLATATIDERTVITP